VEVDSEVCVIGSIEGGTGESCKSVWNCFVGMSSVS